MSAFGNFVVCATMLAWETTTVLIPAFIRKKINEATKRIKGAR